MTIENIDSSNPLPLYFQVYKSLLERIQRGEFLSRKLFTSRTTAYRGLWGQPHYHY